MSKRIGKILSYLIVLSMVLSCLSGLTINVSAMEAAANADGDMEFFGNFMGSDLTHEDWHDNSYYDSDVQALQEIEGLVATSKTVWYKSYNTADPNGPSLGGFMRDKNENSIAYVIMDMGRVLNSLKAQVILGGITSMPKFEYAEDDRKPVAGYGKFDESLYEWKEIDASLIASESKGQTGEWDVANGKRKTDRTIIEATVSKENMPENARYFKVYLPEITDAKRWRSTLSGFGGTYDPNSEPAPNPDDITANWPDGAVIEASNVTETSATISWPEVVVTKGPKEDLTYRVMVNGAAQSGEVKIVDGTCSMELTGLKPGAEHSVSVVIDCYGVQLTTVPALEATVKAADPTMYTWAEGSKVTVSNIATNTADVSWPAIEGATSDITYVVTLGGEKVGETVELSYQLTRLTSESDYTVAISAEKNGVTVSTAPIEASFKTEAVPEGETSVILDTFNKEGLTDPSNETQRQLLFENIHDFGWDMGSNTAHPHDNTIFTQGHVVNAAEGIDSYTLTRKEATEYNKNAHIVYEIPNADMSSFEISFLMTMGAGNIPANATFEGSEDGETFEKITTTVKQGENPTVDGQYKRWTYTGFNVDRIPKAPGSTEYKKIKYLKINFPSPVASNRCQSVQLEKVKLNQNNRLTGWSNNAVITTKDVGEKSITISWPAFEYDGDFEYILSNEGFFMTTLDKDQTSIRLTTDAKGEPIEGNTEYMFELAVVQKNSDDPKNPEADRASQLLMSERIRTNGSPYVLVDKFKFSDSHTIDGANGIGSERWTRKWDGQLNPSWDADWLAIQRGGSNGQGKTPFSVEYYLEVGLVDFSVDFVYGNVGGTPTDSTFQVSVDGKNWVNIPVKKTGTPPGGWNYSILNFKPEDINAIPKGAKFLKIIYGTSTDSANRCFGIKLKKVEISKYDVMFDDIAEFDINDYLAEGETKDGIMTSFNLPDSYAGYPIEWSSSDPDVIGPDGQVNTELLKEYYKDVTLVAGFRHNDEEEDIAYKLNIFVRAAKNTKNWSDQQFIDYDFSLFPDAASVTAPQDPNAVYKAFTLPKGPEGGSTFSWSVSDTEHATIDSRGRVSFKLGSDEEITLDLILTAERGAAKSEKKYTITLSRGYGDNLAKSAVIEASTNNDYAVLVMDREPGRYWESAGFDEAPYLQYDFGAPVMMNTVMLAEAGNNVSAYTIATSDNKRDWKEVISGTTLGDGVQTLIPFAHTTARYLRVSFGKSADATVKISSFEVFNIDANGGDDQDKLKEILKKIAPPSQTRTDITLVKSSLYNSVIEWSSSHERVLDINGKVSRQKNDTKVTLTALATLPSGASMERSYTVTVVGTGSGGGGGTGGGGGLPFVPDNNNPITPDQNTEQIFLDVPASHWASTYINNLHKQGIVSGSGNNRFEPDNNVTREEFVKMILLAMGTEAVDQASPFADVDASAWYAPYVATAYQLGIVTGTDTTTFGVGQLISRQDMAVMADRILKNKGIAPATSAVIGYADNDQIAGYAVEAVQNLADLKVMNGDTENRFNPAANATRAESAKIVSVLNSMLK